MAIIPGAEMRTLSSFSRQFGTSYTILADPGREIRGSRYGLRGNPSVVIIDKAGIARHTGGFTTARAMKKKIESIKNAAEI